MLHTAVVAARPGNAVVVSFSTGVVTGGRVHVASSPSVAGVGKVAWVNVGNRVG